MNKLNVETSRFDIFGFQTEYDFIKLIKKESLSYGKKTSMGEGAFQIIDIDLD